MVKVFLALRPVQSTFFFVFMSLSESDETKVKQIMDLVFQLFIGFSLYKIVHDTREIGILDC